MDEWLAEEVNDAFAAQETDAFINGDGSAKPKGILAYTTAADASHAWGDIGYLATASRPPSRRPNPTDKLIDLIYAPKAQYRPGARFVMNRGRGLGDPQVSRIRRATTSCCRRPRRGRRQPCSAIRSPRSRPMPDIGAGTFSVAFGDFARGYLIVDRAGVRVLRDPYSAKPYVLFYTTKRVGGACRTSTRSSS
ncbi:MAG: phage major capsid protein [Caulobacteraceae bacterium]